MVYTLRPSEVDEIARREKGYVLRPVHLLEDGEASTAVAFISSPWQLLPAPVAPTRRYAELILDGATHKGLPQPYLDWLRAERDGAGRGDRPGAYATPSRRAAVLGAAVATAGCVVAPLGARLWQCRRGWEAGTQRSAFFRAER